MYRDNALTAVHSRCVGCWPRKSTSNSGIHHEYNQRWWNGSGVSATL